eukprot:8958511-Alexandrium_andersonii.AAC.1
MRLPSSSQHLLRACSCPAQPLAEQQTLPCNGPRTPEDAQHKHIAKSQMAGFEEGFEEAEDTVGRHLKADERDNKFKTGTSPAHNCSQSQ